MIIYQTTNLINGKIYIGQDSKDRKNYMGSGKALKNAIQKYEVENFKKETLEICDSKEQLNEKEVYWIEKLNSKFPNGYNLTDGGDGTFGYKQTEQHRKNSSESHKGYKHTEEQKRKIRESCKDINRGKIPWNKGLTKETDERVRRNGLNIKKNHPFKGLTAKTDKRVFERTKKMVFTRYGRELER